MGDNNINHYEELDPDAYTHGSEYTHDGNENHVEKLDAIEEKYAQPIEKEYELLDEKHFPTHNDIIKDRARLFKFGIPMLFVGLIVILTITSFFEVKNNNHNDDIRRASKAAELPQDLNISSDPEMWHTSVDARLDNYDTQLGKLNVGYLSNEYGKEANETNQQQPQPAQLSQEEIVNMITDKLRKEMQGNNTSRPSLENLPPLPRVVVNKSMPAPIQKIAKRTGDKKGLEVDDFLTVPTSERPIVPPTVDITQNNGATLLPPPLLKQGGISKPYGELPPLSARNEISFKNQVKVIDAPELKTGYFDASSKASEAKAKKPYQIMTGLAKATLHTGFRAPTLALGDAEPQPVYMSIDSSIIAANDTSLDIQECTVLGTSKGNLNSERAEIRLAELNCVVRYKNGRIGKITEKINGWVYGEDGIYGLKGRLISGEGKILKAALPISLIQSLIGALSQANGLAQVIVPGIGTAGAMTSSMGSQDMSGMQMMEKGAATGFGKGANQALGQVVSYYMGMLKELNPAIEILGGRNNLTILFKGGEELKESEFEPANINKKGRNN